MLAIYCQKCGSPTHYALNKPRLCSQCGHSFDVNFSIANPSKIVPAIYSHQTTTSRPAFTTTNIPEPELNYEGFSAELVEENVQKVTLADIIKQKPTGFSRPVQKMGKISKLKLEQMTKDLMAQAKQKTAPIEDSSQESE